jgi:hypothetical protein
MNLISEYGLFELISLIMQLKLSKLPPIRLRWGEPGFRHAICLSSATASSNNEGVDPIDFYRGDECIAPFRVEQFAFTIITINGGGHPH